MIIVIFATELNIDNVQILSRSNFLPKVKEGKRIAVQFFPFLHANSENTDVIIFDVNADKGILRSEYPGWLVDKLNEKGVLEHTKNIYFLMSNVSVENPLRCYAVKMADYIYDKYGKIVNTHVPCHIG